MFTFSNNSLANTYSLKPKKNENENKEYTNIINESKEDNSKFLTIDLKNINFENISVELALNILQFKHNEYYNMSQSEIVEYFNEKMKLTNNINTMLALKIILKAKLKGLDFKINKLNGITVSQAEISNDTKKNKTNEVYNQIPKEMSNDNDFKIQQINSNEFKIKQFNTNNLQKNNNQIFNVSDTNLFEHDFLKKSNSEITNNLVKLDNFKNNNTNLNNNIRSNQNSISNDFVKNFNQFPNHTSISNKSFINQNNHSNNISNNHSNNHHSNNHSNNNKNETFNGISIINSSEFDIDSIIKSHYDKKNFSMFN